MPSARVLGIYLKGNRILVSAVGAHILQSVEGDDLCVCLDDIIGSESVVRREIVRLLPAVRRSLAITLLLSRYASRR